MAKLEYFEDEGPSWRARSPRVVLPPAPEVDWARADDAELDSPPRRGRRQRGEISRATSMASSPSRHGTHTNHHHHRRRRRQSSTPTASAASYSVSSSASMRAPPLASLPVPTRPSAATYRRPTAKVPSAFPSAYDDGLSRPESRRSDSRREMSSPSPRRYLSTPNSRRSTRESTSDSDEETDVTFESDGERHGQRERRVVHVRRQGRSREDRRRRRRPRRRREESISGEEYDYEKEGDSVHPRSVDEESESSSSHSPDRDEDSEDQDERERELEPEYHEYHDRRDSRDHRDRRERRPGHHRHRHSSHSSPRDHRRVLSVSDAQQPPPPRRRVLKATFPGTIEPQRSEPPRSKPRKKYYESEVAATGKRQSSGRRANTISGSQTTTLPPPSVSFKKRSSTSTFLGNFFGSSLHAHASDRPIKLVECVVCMDDQIPSRKAAKLKCGHRMCHSCLKRSFKLSVTDAQHMPPKCCTTDNIPLRHVERLFDTEFKKTWNKKFVEYSTRNRLYCPKRTCNEFIKPENMFRDKEGRKYAKCSHCGTKVCTLCSGRLHKSRDCPRDEETGKVLAAAKDNGWQRCFQCKNMVELKEGCNHMTCVCGAQFCMVCGAKWKSCDCPWFNTDAVEADRLGHMQVPFHIRRDRFGPLGPEAGPPRAAAARPRPQTYEEDMMLRRQQEQRDAEYARRLQQSYEEYEEGDDYLGGFGDITGIGNNAGHFMNDDYRRRPQNISVPVSPPPPASVTPDSPAPPFGRANAGGDYISGVQRARGVPRADFLERRLADRFNPDFRHSPAQIPMMPLPPPLPLQPSATMPAMVRPPAPAPPAMAPPLRRHTIEDDTYNAYTAKSTRSADRAFRRPRRVYEEDGVWMPSASPLGRKQHTRDPPKQSVMAGLNGAGRGMNRVYEWSTHVAPGEPEEGAP